MKKIVTLVLGFFMAFQVQAQEKTDAMLFGDVKCNGKHVPYVNITIKNTTIGTMTDETGHYKLANLPVGKITVVAQSIGYKTKEQEVVMKRNKGTELFIDLEEDPLALEQVVVTGTRTKHYIKDVPIRTEVITAKSIEIKNASNLYEVLEGTPGIRVEQQCQYCNFSMIRMQGLGSENTQVLINGQPLYSGLAAVYGLQQMGTDDVDRVEVVKGAGSALCGSGAIAGAINIITKEPSYVPEIKVSTQFGNFGTNKYDVFASLRNEKGNIGLTVNAGKLTGKAIDQTSEGTTLSEVKHKDGISDRVASNLNNAGFGLYASNIFSENDKLILRGRYTYEKREGGIMADDYYKNPFTDGTESITTDRYETELSYKTTFNETSEINFSVAYASHNRTATNDTYLCDFMDTHNDSTPDVRNMRPYLADENSVTGTLTYGKKLNSHHLLIGAQGSFDKLKESGMYVIVDPESDYYGTSYKSISHKSAHELGFFAQDEWQLSNKITIVPGARFDIHHSEEEYSANKQVFTAAFPESKFNKNSFSPRIALKYEVLPKLTLRANVGTGFRAPYGFSEDLHLCSGSPRVWKSSDLEPEKSISYNLSADYYGCKIRFSANLFRTDLKDKIAFADADAQVAALGYDYQWENIDNAFVQGVEASLMTNLFSNLDATVNFTLNQGEYEHARADWVGTQYEKDSKYISRFPASTGDIKFEYNKNGWVFSIDGSYQGRMYIDYYSEDENLSKIKHTSPYMLFNAKITKTIRSFKLYAGAKNIFNYIQPEKHLDDAAFMYAPMYGTMFYAGISVNLIK
ncbi:MAG TPA: TonB-dependent receptor [Tenuifilaceae bacterium]|nr:TonB-dependent receptor [Tenuifilaceae bacterium]